MKTILQISAALLILLAFSCNFKGAEGKNITEGGLTAPVVSEKAAMHDDSTRQNCQEVIMEILMTSPLFKEKTKGLHEAIVSNGGTSYGIKLEGSPEMAKDAPDYSPTYDFNLHESYPTRDVMIARFAFSLEKQQLYECDLATEKLNPIAFDNNLLEKLKQVCE